MMKTMLPPTNLEQWRFVQGFHANSRGVLFGGAVLSWVDEDTTQLACRVGKTGSAFTSVGMDRVSFISPSVVGDRLCFQYALAHVGQKSLTVKAEVFRLNSDGQLLDIFRAFATLVSIDDRYGTPVPAVLTEEVQQELVALSKMSDWRLVEKIKAERKTDKSCES